MIDPIEKLSKDIKNTAKMMPRKAVRHLLDLYYQFQDFRKASASQIRASKADEPNTILKWALEQNSTIERNIRSAMEVFANEYRIGKWMMSITGIGPVITAGLLARLDIRKAKVASHFWSYAGVSPEQKWKKGERCPWNIKLKRLCFIIGDCFIKFQNNPKDYYGQLMKTRKAEEVRKNERREYADQAKYALETKNYGEDTDAIKYYRDGQLPPGHIHMRCIRWGAKMFLSHVFHAMYEDYFDQAPPVPYAFTKMCQGNHSHYIPLPNWPYPLKDEEKRLTDLFKLE